MHLSKTSLKSIFFFAAFSTLLLAQAEIDQSSTNDTSVTVIANAPRAAHTEASASTILPGAIFRLGGVADTREISSIAPNTTAFGGNNNRSPRFSVRGFRENNFLAGEPAVVLYIDDIPYTDLASRGLPLFDVQRAEFLRGPQGTMFGASGPAGVLDIRSRQPNNDWHGFGTFGYGNYDSFNYQAGIGGPVVKDKLFFSVSGLFSQREGFVRNQTLHTRADDQETLAGRAQLIWTPNEHWTVALTVDGGRYRDGFVPTFYPGHDVGFFKVQRDFDGHVNTDNVGEALRIGYQNEKVKVTSVTTHRDWRQNLLQDFDFMPIPIRDGFSKPKLDQWSEELRVQSNDNEKKFRWLGGLYFSTATSKSDSGSDEFFPVPFPGGFVSGPPTKFRTRATGDARTYAAFGQATYSVTEQFDIIGGVRLTYDEREVRRSKTISSPTSTFGGFPAGPFASTFGVYNVNRNFSDVQPKASLVWHFTKDAEAYFNFTSGYQAGGFNVSNDDPAGARFNPMRSWHYEVGAKTAWFENKLAANASLFLIDSHNYQVYRLSATDPSQAFLQNADATMMGAELELAARPAKGWEFDGALGYTHSRYDKYFDSVNGVNLNGKTISFVPEFTANFSAQYKFPFGLYARGEVQGIGDYWLTEDNSAKQSAFALFNARIGYDAKNWGIYIFGRNLANKHYASNALDLRNTVVPGQADQLILQPGDPRTFGFAVTARF